MFVNNILFKQNQSSLNGNLSMPSKPNVCQLKRQKREIFGRFDYSRMFESIVLESIQKANRAKRT